MTTANGTAPQAPAIEPEAVLESEQLAEASARLAERREALQPEDRAPEPRTFEPETKGARILEEMRTASLERSFAISEGAARMREERAAEAAELRRRIVAGLPARLREFDDVEDAVARITLFERVFRLLPGTKTDDVEATLEDFAEQTRPIPLWLLDVALVRIVDDEDRDSWRPTVGEIRKFARRIGHELGLRGDVFRLAREMIGQPPPRRTLLDEPDDSPRKLETGTPVGVLGDRRIVFPVVEPEGGE